MTTNDLGDIAKHATGNESYKTEIRKGIKLSKFVDVKPNYND